jgi:hypothetical protein
MKKFITPTYTFIPGVSGAGTLNLSGITNFNVKYLVAVINQTTGQLVYSTASTAYKYTLVAGTSLTLFADTSAMSGSDVLQVIYEVDEQPFHSFVVDTSVNNIPASVSLPYELTSVTSGRITKVKWSDEIGEVIGLYVGPASSEVLEAVFAFGGDEMPVDIPAGVRVSIRNMKNALITSGYATIQLIG